MSFDVTIVGLLKDAGIVVNGPDPWDIQVHNPALWQRILGGGTLGLGEAYLDGWWDCADLAEFFNRALRADLTAKLRIDPSMTWQLLKARFLNMQTLVRARRVARMHYNLTDAYAATLDARMVGSCAYWTDQTQTLDAAQEAKLDLICRKIGLGSDDTVLDIGCGWGGFMGFAAEKYGARCVGVTVSPEQAGFARQRYADLPVEFHVMDYRQFEGQVDHIVSMGMFEHVGYRNFRAYFETADRILGKKGRFLLHTIGSPISTRTIDPWLEKYIFPGGVLPSVAQIGTAIEGLFDILDLHNIGPHYDRTLVAWDDNFKTRWPAPKTPEEERFVRMWRYYLLCCAGGFRARAIHVWQLLLSSDGVPDDYVTER